MKVIREYLEEKIAFYERVLKKSERKENLERIISTLHDFNSLLEMEKEHEKGEVNE
jgi:hypothetical protein